ncbi:MULTISPECIES: PadR family transcriptional regulator [Limosilactobacillus]|uniref:PadR family transcriptional regulator n=1 Tax=Limosilactobacillus reuteri TaxID=1598 RepID=A0AAX2SUC9_LIMRT|nr:MULTISPECIES: PadR family transcriptional regulator [Limosilactobacillus]MBB1110739.1 PadR family transcriptional regulator [Limosilactobacillus balticus]RMX26251.1 PadR family transcriptional regulator [Limosilactobacillus reuteri]TGB10641.1 PadR family transcriptional regulator [Limosilactobacillus reuteri]
MQGRDIILGILERNSRTGYEINDILKNQLSYFYDGTYGMIYPTLRKLEKEGKITKKQIVQKDKPNKNEYSITNAGEEEFKKYLDSTIQDDIYKSDFLMRLFFGTSLSNQEIKEAIEQEIARKNEKIDKLTQNYKKWKKNGMSKTQEITVKYGITQYTAIVQMLNKELEKLQKNEMEEL